MTPDDFDALISSLLDVVSINKRLGQRFGEAPYVGYFPIPSTTSGEQWRKLIDRLNEVDPEGGWGRAKILGRECIATKGEWQL